jgi:hypothetical protein
MARHEKEKQVESPVERQSPDERHEEFVRRNGNWNKEIEEAIDELERVGREAVETEREEVA